MILHGSAALALVGSLLMVAPPTPSPTLCGTAQTPWPTEVVARIPASAAQAAAYKAFVSRPVGPYVLQAALAADSLGMPWLRLRQDRRIETVQLTPMTSPIRVDLEGATYTVGRVDDNAVAKLEKSGGKEAVFPIEELAAKVYETAPQAALHKLATYAVVFESGPNPHTCLTLWRRGNGEQLGIASFAPEDARGTYFVTHLTTDQAIQGRWLAIINGYRYGVQWEPGADIVFYKSLQPENK